VNNLKKFNNGGLVGYYAAGGNVQGGGMDNSYTEKLVSAMNLFNDTANSLATALNSFPRNVQLETTVKPVEVIINGAEVLSQLQEPLQKMIADKINQGITNLLKDKFPGAGVPTNVV